MNIITKKAKLIPAVKDTRITIRLDDPDALTWGVFLATLVTDQRPVHVDWGDGSSEDLTTVDSCTHTYARTGEYVVSLSDDIMALRLSSAVSGSPFHDVYPLMVRSVRTTASNLTVIGAYAFGCAVNMTDFDCCCGAVERVLIVAFSQCTALTKLKFPHATSLAQSSFAGCVNVTEIHFAKANEAAITSSPAWEASHHTFGADNATVTFDL